MRLGCIDIGSNTTRLLIADSDGHHLAPVHQERAFTRLGHELYERGEIGEAKITEVVTVVWAQCLRAREQGAAQLQVVATEAVRRAVNGAALTDAVSAAIGIPVRVLSPEEEARLAFVGVSGMLGEHETDGELGVVDVGGGSSELVVGRAPDDVRWWASVALGSAVLTHSVLTDDPPGQLQLDGAREQIAGELGALRVPKPGLAVAVGGSATSLSTLAGSLLDAQALTQALELLVRERSGEVAERFGIDPERARLLPAGLLILEGVARVFDAPLRVGQGGIREGVLLEASGK